MFALTAFYTHMIYYINIYINVCYIACLCLVSCVSAIWYALQAQQASNKARQYYYYSSYTQVVDGLVDNSISVDFVVDKFGDGVER